MPDGETRTLWMNMRIYPIQNPIDLANGLENALNTFDALSLEQKNELIDCYEGKKEDFPAA